MENKEITAVIITEDHYNALGMIRSIGVSGIKIILILTTLENSYVDKSKYINVVKKIQHTEHAVIEAINDVCNNTDVQYVIFPLSDFAAQAIDEKRNDLNSSILIPHMEGRMKEISDKFTMKKIAQKCGLTVPEGIIYEFKKDYQNKWNIYPAIIKPLISVEGRKSDIKIVKDADDLNKQLCIFQRNGYHRVLIEQYIHGSDTYMLEVMGASNRDNTVDFAGIIRKIREYPIKNGSTSYAFIEDEQEGISYDSIKQFINHVHFFGLFDVEFKYSNGKAYFIECNFRNGAPGFFLTKYGRNIPVRWIEYNLKRCLEYELNTRKRKYFMVEQTDVINMLKGNPGIFQWLKEYFTADKIFAFREDMKPVRAYYKMFCLSIFRRALRRR